MSSPKLVIAKSYILIKVTLIQFKRPLLNLRICPSLKQMFKDYVFYSMSVQLGEQQVCLSKIDFFASYETRKKKYIPYVFLFSPSTLRRSLIMSLLLSIPHIIPFGAIYIEKKQSFLVKIASIYDISLSVL